MPVRSNTSTELTNFLIQNKEFILNLLVEKGDLNIRNEAIMLLARFADLADQQKKGTATQADLNVLKNQLIDTYLKIIL